VTDLVLPPLTLETDDRLIVRELRKSGLWEKVKDERRRRPGKAFAMFSAIDPAPTTQAIVWCGDGFLRVTGDPFTVLAVAGRMLGGPDDRALH
jgi:hypothetical protein